MRRHQASCLVTELAEGAFRPPRHSGEAAQGLLVILARAQAETTTSIGVGHVLVLGTLAGQTGSERQCSVREYRDQTGSQWVRTFPQHERLPCTRYK
jgi:hypothetical protein